MTEQSRRADRLVKRINKQSYAPVTKDIAGNFILPNLSGDHVRGIKRAAPINGVDLVNKDYVDIVSAALAAHIIQAQAHTDYLLNTSDTGTGDYTLTGGGVDGTLTLGTYATGISAREYNLLINSNEMGSIPNTITINNGRAQTEGKGNGFLFKGFGVDMGRLHSAWIDNDNETDSILALSTRVANAFAARMTINKDKVGIGTATPRTHLDVNGLITQGTGTIDLATYNNFFGNIIIDNANPSIRLRDGTVDWEIRSDTSLVFEHEGTTAVTMANGGFVGVPTAQGIGIVGNERIRFFEAGYIALENANVGIGTATPASKLQVAGAIQSATATITASSDTTDVSGINTLFINITADIVLGGLVGGVNGQAINIIMLGNFVNHVRLEHAEGIGGATQDFINHLSVDEDISHGGCIYICNGTNWYDASHARHV